MYIPCNRILDALELKAMPQTARVPELDPEQLNPEQRALYDKIVSGPRGGIRGPFRALIQSPELGDLVQAVGGYLRFGGTLPGDLRELAILVTARKLKASFEWYAHAPIGIDAGLDADAVEAIRIGKEPDFGGNEDAALVYAVASALHRDSFLDDALYESAVARFGESVVVELVVLCGYYTTIGFVLNSFQLMPPPGEDPFA